MNDLSAFPITRKWPAQHPDRIQLYSLPTPNGVKETRTVAKVSNSGTEVSLRGSLRGLLVGATVGAVLGCGRNMQSCKTLHDNILNYGGQPFIPLDNPLSQKNQFY